MEDASNISNNFICADEMNFYPITMSLLMKSHFYMWICVYVHNNYPVSSKGTSLRDRNAGVNCDITFIGQRTCISMREESVNNE